MLKTVFLFLLLLSFHSNGEGIAVLGKTQKKHEQQGEAPTETIKETARYFCASHLKSGERASQYFDRLLLIKKSALREGSYTASFPLHTEPPFEMKQRGTILFGYFQIFAGKQKPNELYREEYNIYRLNTNTGVLIQSHVKYTSQQYYERVKADIESNPHSASLSSKPLQFIDKELPKGLVKFGWDGSRYVCKKISYLKYLLHSIGGILMQIFGA